MLTLTENRPDVVDLKRNKVTYTKKKKSGPPCGVDFKRELTSTVLTSRGFHCNFFFKVELIISSKLGKKSLYFSKLHYLTRSFIQ